MTEMAGIEAPVTPRLVHAGTYALYETPDGGRHLTYRPTTQTAPDGHLVEAADAEDQHLPDIPPEALPLIDQVLTNGIPAQVLAMLSGKLNPMAVMKAMRNGTG
jgi:hypothetical protein